MSASDAKSAGAAKAGGQEAKSKLQKIKEGFKIVKIHMSDEESGKVLWERSTWQDVFKKELKIVVPASILGCSAVARTMRFASVQEISKFRLEQKVKLSGTLIELWNFKVGLVIPGSENTWQCVIASAGKRAMLPASILSGNVTIETKFFDGEDFIADCTLRVYYK